MNAMDALSRAPTSQLTQSVILRAALLCLLWWALTGGRSDAWGVGSIAIVMALVLSLKLMPPSAGISLAGLAGFTIFFLLQSVKGGMQVARIALRPRLSVNPALIDISVRLPEGRAQVMLTGTLSLLPGTLARAIDGGRMQLHVLDKGMPAEQEVRTAEKWIARLLRVELQ